MEFVKNNWMLIALAFVSGAMLLWPLVRRVASGAADLSTLEATQLINREDALVLDVRTAEDFSRGHILGAKNVPLGELETRAPEVAKNRSRPLIVVCERGSRSPAAAATLRRLGYERVYSLAGGIVAWQQAGLPVEK